MSISTIPVVAAPQADSAWVRKTRGDTNIDDITTFTTHDSVYLQVTNPGVNKTIYQIDSRDGANSFQYKGSKFESLHDAEEFLQEPGPNGDTLYLAGTDLNQEGDTPLPTGDLFAGVSRKSGDTFFEGSKTSYEEVIGDSHHLIGTNSITGMGAKTEVAVLTPSTGETIWESDLSIQASLAEVDPDTDQFFVVENDKIKAFKFDDTDNDEVGDTNWTTTLPAPIRTVAGEPDEKNVADSIYAGLGETHDTIYALSKETGDTDVIVDPSFVDSKNDSKHVSTIVSSDLVDGRDLYINVDSGPANSNDNTTTDTFMRFNPRTQTPIWKFKPVNNSTPSPIDSVIFKSNDIHVILSSDTEDQALYALNDTGTILWIQSRGDTGPQTEGNFAWTRNRIILKNKRDTGIFARDATAGTISWRYSLSSTKFNDTGPVKTIEPTFQCDRSSSLCSGSELDVGSRVYVRSDTALLHAVSLPPSGTGSGSSGGSSGSSVKVKSEGGCLIGKRVYPESNLTLLRHIRDDLLLTKFGRVGVQFYYTVFGLD